MTTPIACAVASKRYLAHARVLVDSFFEHNPEQRFTLLFLGDREDAIGVDARADVLTLEGIGLDRRELNRLGLMYPMQGLAGAMKGRLLRHLLGRGESTALLLDADICVYADLSPLWAAAPEAGPLLSVGITEPPPPDHGYGAERMLFRAGVFSAAVMAVARGGVPFLDWWNERTSRHCVLSPEEGFAWEQGWLALAPVFFPHQVLRDAGGHVTAASLTYHDIEWSGERPRIEGQPVRCFHFLDGYDPENPDRLLDDPYLRDLYPSLDERPGAGRISQEYGKRLIAAGYRECRDAGLPYQALPGGTPVEPEMRDTYRRALIDAEERGGDEPPNPFESGDAEAFLQWFERSGPATGWQRDARSHAPGASYSR